MGMEITDNTTRVRLDIPDKEHTYLRILAAQSGVSMAHYCKVVVLEAVRKGRVLKAEKKEK